MTVNVIGKTEKKLQLRTRAVQKDSTKLKYFKKQGKRSPRDHCINTRPAALFERLNSPLVTPFNINYSLHGLLICY